MENTISSGVSDGQASHPMAAPPCCWFCKTAMKEDEGLQVEMHGNVRWKFKRIPSEYGEMVKQNGEEHVLKALREKFDHQLATQTLGDVFACTWETTSVTVPRCADCRTIHARVAALKDKFFNASMIAGIGIGVGVGIMLWINLQLRGDEIAWAMGISLVVIMVLSTILGNGIANACKKRWHRGVLFESDVAAFPPVQKKLADGWKLGNAPLNKDEEWEWGLK